MNAAVLSPSDKVFLCPGLPASRNSRVQSASATCLGFDIFLPGHQRAPLCATRFIRASLAPHSGSSRIFLWFPPSSSPCNFARQSKIFQQSFPVWSSRLTRLRVSQRMKSRWSGICSRDSRGKALAAHRLPLVVVVVVPPPQDSDAFFLLQDEERESGIPESSLTFKECRCPQSASERKSRRKDKTFADSLGGQQHLCGDQAGAGCAQGPGLAREEDLRVNPVTMEKKACPSPHPLQ